MTSQPKPFFRRLQIRLAQARFFTFSALLHVALVILGGSVVLIKNAIEPPDFQPGEGEFFVSDASASQPPPAPPQSLTPQFTPPTPQASAPNFQALVANGATPSTFALTASPTAHSLDNKLGKLADASGQGIADAIKKTMDGATRMGGKGGFFGMREKAVSALTGTFYDLKQTRRKKPTGISPDEYHQTFRRFVRENWRASILDDYFQAPQPLYATQIMIPNMSADEGPKAFGLEKEVQPSRWLVHYKARVSPPEDGTYHFVGAGDDVMVVRFNGKVVLDRCWGQHDGDWQPDKNYDYGWTRIPNGFAKGDPIHVRAAQAYELEVLIGEQPGGSVFACLMMEKVGGQYERDGRGNPILPTFRVAETPMPELEKGQTLPPYAASGPVWKALPAGAGGGSAFKQFFGQK